MGDLRAGQGDAEALYEITVQGVPPINLTARFPSMTLFQAPATTILSRYMVDAAEIDGLMERLRSIGVTPLGVHASPGGDPPRAQPTESEADTSGEGYRPEPSPACDYYEFRIEGRLGDSILNYLQWASRLEQERTLVRVLATQADLQVILEELVDGGVRIDHFIRRQAS